MATEEAIPDIPLTPTCPFIVEEGWPVLSNQHPVRLYILILADDAVEEWSAVRSIGCCQQTFLDPSQMHPGVGGGLGIVR